MRRVYLLLLTLLVAYLGLCLLLAVFQGRLIFLPASELGADPDAIGMTFEEVEAIAEDGVRLHGWWIPADEPQGVVLFSHGNAGNIAGRLYSAREFAEMGFSVLLFDYRGYGRSEGQPSEEGLYLDAVAFYDLLVQERKVEPRRLLVYGESIGVGVSIELACRRSVAGLIAESGFTSMGDAGAEHYPWLPVRMLLRHRFENEAKIGTLDIPILIVHSPDDEIVPFDHGRALFDAAREPRELLKTGGGHNDGGFLQRQEWRAAVRQWALSVLAEN